VARGTLNQPQKVISPVWWHAPQKCFAEGILSVGA
jgi:hypothetical protein